MIFISFAAKGRVRIMTEKEVEYQLIIDEAWEARQKEQTEKNRARQQRIFNILCDFTERVLEKYDKGSTLPTDLLSMAIEAGKAVLSFKP